MKRARVVLPKSGGRTRDFSSLCPTQKTAKTAEIPRTQSPLVFLAFLCLCRSRNFSFLRSSLRFYSHPHPLLLHPTAATAPSHECTGHGYNPSSMFTGRNAALLLTTPSRSVKFFEENERLFIRHIRPCIDWVVINGKKLMGFLKTIELWHRRLKEKLYAIL